MLVTQPPLYVKVTETRYDLYGEPTLYNEYLSWMLRKYMGGISHTVKPGLYIFRIMFRGFKPIAQLTAVE